MVMMMASLLAVKAEGHEDQRGVVHRIRHTSSLQS